jgi:hypothetical protein
MSRWFRFYDEALNDPKILKLSDKLHRLWVGILCVASKNNGELPSLDDLALMVRIKPQKLEPMLKKLEELGLIDTDEAVRKPHNWDRRQYKSDVSTDRVKRFRNGQRNVSETPPDTEQIQITEQKEDAAPSAQPIDFTAVSLEKQLFDRGKQILGHSSGGLIKKLVSVKSGSIDLARSALEMAATKADPREYIGAIIRGRDGQDDARARGDAW